MKHAHPWLRIGHDLWSLAFDASSVIGLRMMKIARGGRAAAVESQRMVQEKIDAGVALQTKALTGQLGQTPDSAVARTIAHYRSRVRANRRRLSKS